MAQTHRVGVDPIRVAADLPATTRFAQQVAPRLVPPLTRALSAAWAMAWLVGACNQPLQDHTASGVRAPIIHYLRNNGDTVFLPAAPALLDSLQILPEPLEPDLVIARDELGDIAAVTETRSGHILVLIRRDGFVLMLDSAGHSVRRLSRAGDGPGELNRPYAMAALKHDVILLQELAPGNSLSRISLGAGGNDGRAPPIKGDWLMFSQRGPNVLLDYPIQSGIEDWTRRIAAETDSTFVVEVRVPADPPGVATRLEAAPQRSLIVRFSADLALLDTLASLPAPRSIYATQGDESTPPRLASRLFDSRPVWAVGDGWLALSHGDSNHIRIALDRQPQELVIAWPRRREAITESHRLSAGHWAATYTARAFPKTASQFSRMSEEQMRRVEALYLGYIAFADSVPMVQALFGAGQCLWASTFEPSTFFDGTGMTIVGMHVSEPTAIVAARMPFTDLRIRHVSARWVYAKRVDDEGVPQLIRFRLPSLKCQ